MATQTQSTTSPPEITILNRVYSIPLIGSSIDTINSTLASNSFTSTPYSTAKGLSASAYKLSEPFQVRLAPLIVRADDIANKAVDVVESRYPYPFKAKPEEVATLIRERRESSEKYVRERRDSAYKTIDDNVKSPAFTYVQAIDQRFTPIVDYFEVTVTKLNPQAPRTPESKYQYQRALALSKSLTDNQGALVQRAAETAHTISNLATTSFHSAQTRLHELSDAMVTDLRRLQTSLSSDFTELSATLHGIIADLGKTLKSDLPLNEKIIKVTEDVKDRVSPVLDGMRTRVSDIVQVLAKKGEETVGNAKEITKPNANGNGNGNA